MLGPELSAETVRAAAIVGIVLAQALVLYFAYGGLQQLLGPRLVAVIENG